MDYQAAAAADPMNGYAERYGQAFADRACKRLAHVEKHLQFGFDIPMLVRNITCNLGNPNACLGTLSDHSLGSAMTAWFRDGDLAAMRQWCHVAGRLDQMLHERTQDRSNPAFRMQGLLKPLLSNDARLIGWFATRGALFEEERVRRPGTDEHWAYQAHLALQGEGDALVARSEAFFGAPAAARNAMTGFEADYRFWAALGRGDVAGMQGALEELVAPKLLRSHADLESGFTQDLISTLAVIYAKVAWYHGHEVAVASPFIPAAWLPMTPLPWYDAHYEFLEQTKGMFELRHLT